MSPIHYRKKITVTKTKDGRFVPPQPKEKTMEIEFRGMIMDSGLANIEAHYDNKRQYRLTLNYDRKELMIVVDLNNHKDGNPNIFNEIVNML